MSAKEAAPVVMVVEKVGVGVVVEWMMAERLVGNCQVAYTAVVLQRCGYIAGVSAADKPAALVVAV